MFNLNIKVETLSHGSSQTFNCSYLESHPLNHLQDRWRHHLPKCFHHERIDHHPASLDLHYLFDCSVQPEL